MNKITSIALIVSLAFWGSLPVQCFSQSEDEAFVPPIITLVNPERPSDDATPEEIFNMYARQLGDIDITVTKPSGYKDMRMNATSRNQFFNNKVGNAVCQIGLQSPDEHAVILLPVVFLNFGVPSLQEGTTVEYELRQYNNDGNLDITPLLNIIAQDDMSQYANADTAAIYSFELKEPYLSYMGRYNHCIGIYLRKYGHPALLLKIAVDDEGLKNKEVYLRQLFDNIHYGDKETPLTPYENKLRYRDLVFPSGKNVHTRPEDFRFKLLDFVREKWEAENDSLKWMP